MPHTHSIILVVVVVVHSCTIYVKLSTNDPPHKYPTVLVVAEGVVVHPCSIHVKLRANDPPNIYHTELVVAVVVHPLKHSC